MRLGLPLKFLPQARDAARVQVETFRVKSSELRLAALFEQEKKPSNWKIKNSALRDDSFYISGMKIPDRGTKWVFAPKRTGVVARSKQR